MPHPNARVSEGDRSREMTETIAKIWLMLGWGEGER
jgi:hypothetical protein